MASAEGRLRLGSLMLGLTMPILAQPVANGHKPLSKLRLSWVGLARKCAEVVAAECLSAAPGNSAASGAKKLEVPESDRTRRFECEVQ